MPLDNDDIKQLIAILQKGLTPDQTEPIVDDEDHPQQATKKQKRQTKKTKPPQKQIKSNNKFDTMFEKNMHIEDISIDKKLAKHPPSIRSREFALVPATCRVCGKSEKVNPSLVYEGRYKCNKCARQPG